MSSNAIGITRCEHAGGERPGYSSAVLKGIDLLVLEHLFGGYLDASPGLSPPRCRVEQSSAYLSGWKSPSGKD